MTVLQLYEYAKEHNYLNAEVATVVDIMNTHTPLVSLDNKIEYTIEDLLQLLSL